MLTLRLVQRPSQGVNQVCLPPECFLLDGVAFLSTPAKWYKKPTGPGLSDCAHGQPQSGGHILSTCPAGPPPPSSPVSAPTSFPEGTGLETRAVVGGGLLPTVLVLPWSHLLHCPLEGHKDRSTMHLSLCGEEEVMRGEWGVRPMTHAEDS